MSGGDNLEALLKIKNEVDKSNINITKSEECFKTLLRISKRLKEDRKNRSAQYALLLKRYEGVKNNNLEAEKSRESLIKQMRAMNETSVELTKNILILKERNLKEVQIMDKKVKENQEIWLQCKKRYESLPLVRTWLDMKNTGKFLKDRADNLENEKSTITDAIRSKQKQIKNIEQTLIMQFSDFMVRVRPQLLNAITNKKAQIKIKENEIENIMNQRQCKDYVPFQTTQINKRLKLNPESCKNMITKHDLTMLYTIKQHYINMPNVPKVPKDLISMSSEIKVIENKIPESNISLKIMAPFKEDTLKTSSEVDSWINRYFVSGYSISQEKPKQVETNRKEIVRVIDDVIVNDLEVQTIVSTVTPKCLIPVDTIGAQKVTATEEHLATEYKGTECASQSMEIFENADDDALMPPSQFCDKNSNVDTPSMSKEVHNSTCNASEESCAKMKESYLKTHDLDITPEFIYERNPLQKKKGEKITSKFFKASKYPLANTPEGNVPDIHDGVMNQEPLNEIAQTPNELSENIDNAMIATFATSTNEYQNSQTYVFNGREGILESFDLTTMSINTDDECPEYQDSSVLLSPKADLQDDTEHNVGQLPNFLSKINSAVPFLGDASNQNNEPGTSAQDTKDDFSFNFAAIPKKGRFFNLFS